jgi:hypothetical protein
VSPDYYSILKSREVYCDNYRHFGAGRNPDISFTMRLDIRLHGHDERKHPAPQIITNLKNIKTMRSIK